MTAEHMTQDRPLNLFHYIHLYTWRLRARVDTPERAAARGRDSGLRAGGPVTPAR